MYAVSLVVAEAARNPVDVQRLTSWPSLLRLMKFLSRSSFTSLAMRAKASSQLMDSHLSLPGARYSGCCNRVFAWTKSSSAAPFGQSVPRFTGWSGSPSIWMMEDLVFFDLSPMLYMMTPQATEQ